MKRVMKVLILTVSLALAVQAAEIQFGSSAEEKAIKDRERMTVVTPNPGSDPLVSIQSFPAPGSMVSSPVEIQIGTGTATSQHLPIAPFYGYSYSQTIYLKELIGTAGQISEIRYLFGGGEIFTDSVDVYMGETSANSFISSSDWLPLSSMTRVYHGVLTTTLDSGWVSLVLDTPFDFSNTANLVVAVDENTSGYHSSSSDFLCTQDTEYRSLVYYSDSTNPDPSTPTTATTWGFYIPNITLVVNTGAPATATLTGMVSSATTGSAIAGATVSVAGLTATSGSDGVYIIENVPLGALMADFYGSPLTGDAPLDVQFTDNSVSNAQTVTASASGYMNYTNTHLIVSDATTITFDISLSPALTAGAMRMVLNWDDNPADLDSHLKTPDIGGQTYHVYYSTPGSYDMNPYAILDVDDQNGYGPETITIQQFFTGTYQYYIQKYAGAEYLSQSNAVVQIYDINGLLQTVNVPTSGTGNYWYVCDIDGSTQAVKLVNQIVDTAPGPAGKGLVAKKTDAQIPPVQSTASFTYSWDFGDGGSSAEQSPLHSYTAAGTYSVSLTVSDGSSSDTRTLTDMITVNAATSAVTADFSSDVQSGLAPLTVNFVSQSTGDISSYSWDLNGDGAEDANVANPSFTYAAAGSYDVSLTVSDALGNEDVMTKSAYISVTGDTPPPPDSPWTWLNPVPQAKSIWEMNFVSSTIGYAVGMDGLAMKTVDAGNSWTVLDFGRSEDLYSMSFINATTGYMGGENGLFMKTTDGGLTTEVLAKPSSYIINDMQFLDVNTGFAVSDYGIISKTVDGGQSWTSPVSNAGTNSLQTVFFLDSNTGFAAGGNSSSSSVLVKTTDGGATWTPIALPITYRINDLFFVNSNVGYAGGYYGKMIKTTDGGATWTEVATSVYQTIYDIEFFDENNGVISCEYYWYITHDGGLTWTTTKNISGFPGYTMAFADTQNGYVGGFYGHMLKTTDGGTTWNFANSVSTESLFDISYLDDQNAVIAGAYGTALVSQDGGLTWQRQNVGDNYNYLRHALYTTEPVTGNPLIMLCGDYGKIFKSGDKGQTWSSIQTSSASTLYSLVNPADNVFYAAGYAGKVTKSTDGGVTWSDISTSYTNYIYDLHFFDALNGLAVGGYYGDSKVYRTIDGGVTWTDLAVSWAKACRSVYFVDNLTGFIAGDDGLIMKTTDGGATWTDESVSTINDFYDISFVNATQGFAAGSSGLFYGTQNGGTSWEAIPMDFGPYFYAAEYRNDALTLVGMTGTISRYTPTLQPLPLTANFTADVTSGTAPLTVQFTDQSTGDVAGYSWDLDGDGSEDATVANPSFTYVSAGSYDVTLTVRDAQNAGNVMTKSAYITVTAAVQMPVADFSADLTRGPAPLTVQFTDLSSGDPTTLQWTFGDGESSTTANPLHTYLLPGAYTVSLTAANTSGDSTLVREQYILVTKHQSIALEQGWNWFSMNLKPLDPRPDSVLASLAANGSMVKSQFKYANQSGNAWIGELDSIKAGPSYMIRMTNRDTLQVDGLPLPILAGVPVDSGWNWIGFTGEVATPLNNSIAAAGSFATFIKSQFGFAYYYPGYGWYGSLANLEPGLGYKMMAVAPGTVHFMEMVKKSAQTDILPVLAAADYGINPHAYMSGMSVVGTVKMPNGDALNENTVILARSGDSVRGAALLHESPFGNGLIFTMTVYGNEQEALSFEIRKDEGLVGRIDGAMSFTPDGMIGTALAPFELALQVTGLSESYLPENYSLSQNYPNPFNPVTHISYGLPENADVVLTLYSISGQKVRTLLNGKQPAGWYSLEWDARNDAGIRLATGIYICRIIAKGENRTFSKVIKMAYLK